MFNADFFPTPPEVIMQMLQGEPLTDSVVLEPSAGRGDIADFCAGSGASVICCEKDPHLLRIVKSKHRVIAEDFLTVTSEQVSHVHYIVMNPPFSADEKHILHAFSIAPPGCRIIALCNSSTIKNQYTSNREQLGAIVDHHGTAISLGQCFTTADRKTYVDVSLIKITKPGQTKESEFSGFFLDEDPEERQENGIMPYNVVRDIVNRYVGAVKIFDKQIEAGIEMNNLLDGFYGEGLAFNCTENGAPKVRNDFKKDLQKAAWNYVINKMSLEKYATRGLRDEINKFVEQQHHVPFTMRNIYHMLDMVVQTAGERMDKAIEEVFDIITAHSADNRYNVPGWKTNSHYLMTKRFIMPQYRGSEVLDDLQKALCFVTGERYEDHVSLEDLIRYDYFLVTEDGKFITHPGHEHRVTYKWYEYQVRDKHWDFQNAEKAHPGAKLVKIEKERGVWFDWSFFRVKWFKNGNKHFEFRDEDTWAMFNQRIARIKGYPLFEGRKQSRYQERQTGRAKQARGFNFTAAAETHSFSRT